MYAQLHKVRFECKCRSLELKTWVNVSLTSARNSCQPLLGPGVHNFLLGSLTHNQQPPDAAQKQFSKVGFSLRPFGIYWLMNAMLALLRILLVQMFPLSHAFREQKISEIVE